jgi:hypothetical protein
MSLSNLIADLQVPLSLYNTLVFVLKVGIVDTCRLLSLIGTLVMLDLSFVADSA